MTSPANLTTTVAHKKPHEMEPGKDGYHYIQYPDETLYMRQQALENILRTTFGDPAMKSQQDTIQGDPTKPLTMRTVTPTTVRATTEELQWELDLS